MNVIIKIGLAACLFASGCGDSESHTIEITAGLETQSGVEPIESASELAVYPGFSGGHIAFVWLGDDVPNECLEEDSASECRLQLFVSLANGVLVDRVIPINDVESPLPEWSRRLLVPLDFSLLGSGFEAPLGEVADLQLVLSLDGSSTEVMSASVTLVEGQSNPDFL